MHLQSELPGLPLVAPAVGGAEGAPEKHHTIDEVPAIVSRTFILTVLNKVEDKVETEWLGHV